MFENLFGGGKKKPEPATEKQRKFADELGIRNAGALSKDQASDAITKKLDAQARRRKGWISSLEERIEALEKRLAKRLSGKPLEKRRNKWVGGGVDHRMAVAAAKDSVAATAAIRK